MTSSPTHYEVLDNGLTLLLREAHLAPVVDLQIWARVGSADETDAERGLAHFHEHMLFKGTERRGVGEIAGAVEGAGGRINAYTSFDVTVYHATLPADALSTGVDVLCDAVRHSLFDPAEIEREIEVVLEEIRRSDDAPLHVLGDAVFREAYHEHPYGLPILGTAESVSGFDRDRVRKFFERWYAADNLTVVAAGDFDAAELARILREAFDGARPARAARGRPMEPPQSGLRTIVLTREFERVRLDLSWRGAAFRDEDATALDLLSFILGECDSSRLVQRVKERDGAVDRIDSGSYSPLDPGLFSITVDVDSARARDAIRATLREVERLRAQPVTGDELERARANFLATEHFERESVSGLSRKLGSFQVLGGDWRREDSYLESVRRATPDDLRRVARRYLVPEGLTVGALLPTGEADALDDAAIREAVEAGIDDTRSALAAPVPKGIAKPTTGPAATRDEWAIHSFELAGGVQLHVQPRRELPIVAGRLSMVGGLLAEEPATSGLTSFLTSVWLRGTRTRSAADWARSVENLAAEVDSFSGRNSLGVTFESTSDKLGPVLDLAAELLCEPDFDAEEIERERRDTLAAIARREDRLAQLAYLLFAETHYASHPYRMPMLGRRESVESFDADTLRAYHARLVRAGNAVVGVAGDVDPETLAEMLSARLSELPRDDFAAPVPPMDPPPDAVQEALLEKDRAQAHLVIGFRGVTVADPDRHALEVIAQLLAGQGGRLFLELRDKQGLAYSVNAMNVEGVAPGHFTVYIATAPDKLEAARTGMLTELERLLQDPVSDSELDRARRYLTGNFAIDQQRGAARAAHLSLDALYGLGADASFHYADQVRAVTSDDVRRVAQQVLRLDAYTQACVRP